jgi:hypothetical protein
LDAIGQVRNNLVFNLHEDVRSSMFEVTNPSEDHRHILLVAEID